MISRALAVTLVVCLGPCESMADAPLLAASAPPTLAFSAARYRVREGSSANVTVRRSNDPSAALTVDYAAYAGSATLGDFSIVSGTLTFPPGALARTFRVATTADSAAEGPEDVLLVLSAPSVPATLGPQSSALLRIDDDDRGGTIQFAASRVAVAEGATATIRVTRKGGLASGVSVQYAATGGTATAGADYALATGTLSFAAGQSLASFSVPVAQDVAFEGDETVVVALSDPTGGAFLGPTSSATITVADDESTLFLAPAEIRVTERARTAVLALRRSGDLSAPASVDLETGGGSAQAGEDYAPTSAKLVFAPKVAVRTLVVPLMPDAMAEGDETVGIALSNATGGQLTSDPGGVLTIADDDAAGVLQFASGSVVANEATHALTLTVRRSDGGAGGVAVDFAVTGGSATDGDDYTLTAGTLSFAPGVQSRTVALTLVDDPQPEGPETVTVSLSNPQGGASIGPTSATTLFIVDDDGGEPGVSLVASTLSVREPAGAKFGFVAVSLRRTGSLDEASSVRLSTSDDTAVAGEDYEAQTNVEVGFAVGKAAAFAKVDVLADSLDEPNEDFTVTLSDPVGATLVGPSSVPVRILDDDLAGTIQLEASEVSVGEGGAASLAVRRTNGAAGGATVAYATSPDSADVSDFTPTAGTLTFHPGEMSQTLLVPISADDIDEGVERFHLNLSATGGGAALGVPATATVWIAGTAGPPAGTVSTWSTPVPGGGVQAMSGGVSNGALGDKSLQGRPDSIVFASAETVGSGSVYLHRGRLQGGPTTRIQVWDGPSQGAMFDASAVQDTIHFDFHIVSATNPGRQIHYWRYRPTRDTGPGPGQGRITGFAPLAHIVLPTTFATTVAPSIIEVRDGEGKKRLVVFGQTGESGGPTQLLLFTSAPGPASEPDYGVTPDGPADFTGAQGEASATLVVTHPAHDFWETALFVEQHPASRTIECFAMSGTHGVEGEHSRTPLRVSPSNPSHWVVGAPEWYSKLGGAWQGTAGGFGAVAPDDSIWWTWSGAGAEQHFSRVDGSGAVTHDVIPSPGETSLAPGAGQFPFMNHMAVSATGAVASLVTSTFPPYRVVLRVFDGYQWTETPVASLPDYNIQGCGFRGTTLVDGAEWMALFVAQLPGESIVAAATFPR